jgi:hypothetical protein
MLFYVAVDSNDSKLYLRCASEKRLIYGEEDEQILQISGVNSNTVIQKSAVSFTKLTISDSVLGQSLETYTTFKKVSNFYPYFTYRTNMLDEW